MLKRSDWVGSRASSRVLWLPRLADSRSVHRYLGRLRNSLVSTVETRSNMLAGSRTCVRYVPSMTLEHIVSADAAPPRRSRRPPTPPFETSLPRGPKRNGPPRRRAVSGSGCSVYFLAAGFLAAVFFAGAFFFPPMSSSTLALSSSLILYVCTPSMGNLPVLTSST